MNKQVFLNKKMVTGKTLSEEGVLAYISLRMIMNNDVDLINQSKMEDYVSLNRLAFVLMGVKERYEKSFLDSLKNGVGELAEKKMISILCDLSGKSSYEYILNFENLYLDTEKEKFIVIVYDDIYTILNCDESEKKKISLLKFFVALVGTFDGSKCMILNGTNYRCKIGHMTQTFIAEEADVSKKTVQRYNDILCNINVIYIYKCNDKIRIENKLQQINNFYSRYADKQLCISYGTMIEMEYGYKNKLHHTKKNKEQADHNRSLAQIYNRICAGYEENYDKETIKMVYEYIHNKNRYLQKQIDDKNRQEYLSQSDRDWIDKLESQIRNEDVFEQFDYLKDQWGVPDKMDYSIEEMFEMPFYSDVVEEEENDIEETKDNDIDLIDFGELFSGKWDNSKKLSISNPFRE